MLPGDLVFIYESKSGKSIIETAAYGTRRKIRRKPGRHGVIALAQITSTAIDLEDSKPELYADGTKTWWRYKANARVINSRGFIGREELAGILGYSPKYTFHGFGDKNSGVKQLSPLVFQAIRSAFLTGEPGIGHASPGHQRSWGGGAGEGPEHKSLKNYIAAQPEQALNEQGLRTIKVEFEFPTNDKIDVLLQDQNGRPVTVEVEIDCDDSEVAGPLQCMKYRALIAYLWQWRVPEVRTVLAARSIASSVQKRCREYNVEMVEIPTWPVS